MGGVIRLFEPPPVAAPPPPAPLAALAPAIAAETEAQRRLRRGRLETIATSERGLLQPLAGGVPRKSLLGE
jgi:hypothetical protein